MQKREGYTTPVGTLSYPCFIDSPDTNFDDSGVYKGRILIDPESAKGAEFIAQLESAFDRHIEELKVKLGKKKIKIDSENRPWGPELDRETDEETGMIEVRTKLNARVEPKGCEAWDQKPKVFNRSGEPYTDDCPRIGAGSVAQLGGKIHLWHNSAKGGGMTLWLEGVMLKTLVEKSGTASTADEFGFSVAEPVLGDDGDVEFGE